MKLTFEDTGTTVSSLCFFPCFFPLVNRSEERLGSCPHGGGLLLGAGRLGTGEAAEEQEGAWGKAVRDRGVCIPVLKGETLSMKSWRGLGRQKGRPQEVKTGRERHSRSKGREIPSSGRQETGEHGGKRRKNKPFCWVAISRVL